MISADTTRGECRGFVTVSEISATGVEVLGERASGHVYF